MHMYSKDLDKENLYGMEATSPDSNWMKPFKSQINHISMILLTLSVDKSTALCKSESSSSLSVGHYELCRDDIGDLPGSPKHL